MADSAALLINLGSPDSTKVSAVRRYLREFLGDPRVIDAPAPVRWMVLNCFILPFRPAKSAEAYRRIWLPGGSPLILTTFQQAQLVQARVPVTVAVAMRYGRPSIPEVLEGLFAQGLRRLYIVPLYPHYAMSSYETVVVKVTEEIQRQQWPGPIKLLEPFYNDPEYIAALAESARPHLETDFDHLLFSFHGLPERHLRKSDPSHAHCLTRPDCCRIAHPSHATCYRHQCFQTTRLLAQALGLPHDRYSVSFQSRLGRDPWLRPYTDQTIVELARRGVRRLRLICPAFVSDCLETLEEIAMAGRETFREHGGTDFTLIPCLNTHPRWIDFLVKRIENWAGQKTV